MDAAIARLASAIELDDDDPRPVGVAVYELFQLGKSLDRSGKAVLSAKLEPLLRSQPLERLGKVALLAGALLETGGDALALPAAIFERIAEALATVEVSAEGAPDFELPEAFYQFESAATAALSRSQELRRSLPQRALIQARSQRYRERYGRLNKLLSVLESEPVIVLHPETGRGWQCRISGIVDNFQLHALLLAAFAGEGADRIEGHVPSAEAIAAAGTGEGMHGGWVDSSWQLANWPALRPGGEIADHTSGHWIWNEGFPAEIALLDGMRIVLVGPGINRRWNVERQFSEMPGHLIVEAAIPDAQQQLTRILSRVSDG